MAKPYGTASITYGTALQRSLMAQPQQSMATLYDTALWQSLNILWQSLTTQPK